MKIVCAFNSYGLGHATRSLPIIKELIKQKHKVYIICYGRSLEFLKRELKNSVAEYFELFDYSFYKVFTKKKFSSKRFLFFQPLFMKEVRAEHKALVKLHAKYKFDLVYSDGRTGIYLPGVPSYLLTNQIKVGTLDIFKKFAENYSQIYMSKISKNFTKILVPDSEKDSISGELTHNLKYIPKDKIEYIGILSMLEKKNCPQDIDYFFSISGPEPQRTVFEHKVLKQINCLQGKNVVITLGRPELADHKEKNGTITTYGLLNPQQQSDIMNRAKLVITRSGYSTVMDLAELDKKALYIPTKGQPEQEYLAVFHKQNKHNYFVKQDKLKLPEDLYTAEIYPGYKPLHKTKESVRRFIEIIKRS